MNLYEAIFASVNGPSKTATEKKLTRKKKGFPVTRELGNFVFEEVTVASMPTIEVCKKKNLKSKK